MTDKETMEIAVKQAKMKRRNSKAVLTHLGKTVAIQVSGGRSADEVKRALKKYEKAFADLVSKHAEYTLLIEDASVFESEVAWLEECQEIFMRLKLDTEDYIKERMTSQKNDYCTGSSEPQDKTADKLVIQQESHTGSAANHEQSAVDDKSVGATAQNSHTETNPDSSTAQVGKNGTKETVPSQISSLGAENSNKSECAFGMEKPKMPKFSGDLRDYVIFKADFKHLIETRYSKRDAITLLRASLQGKLLELIKGIGQDYDAAWEYLDSIYGDPRFVHTQ